LGKRERKGEREEDGKGAGPADPQGRGEVKVEGIEGGEGGRGLCRERGGFAR